MGEQRYNIERMPTKLMIDRVVYAHKTTTTTTPDGVQQHLMVVFQKHE